MRLGSNSFQKTGDIYFSEDRSLDLTWFGNTLICERRHRALAFPTSPPFPKIASLREAETKLPRRKSLQARGLTGSFGRPFVGNGFLAG